MLNSGDAVSRRESFLSCSWMTLSAAAGTVMLASFSVSCWTRSSFSSTSIPSSFLMILSCSVRKCLRCILDTFSSICLWMVFCISACSSSILRRRSVCESRSCTSKHSNTFWREPRSAVVMLVVMSARRPGFDTSTWLRMVWSCSLNRCSSFTMLFNVDITSSIQALMILSEGSKGLSESRSTETVRNGSFLTAPVIRMRPAPATSSCIPSCWTPCTCTIWPRHPISWISSRFWISLPSSIWRSFVRKSPMCGYDPDSFLSFSMYSQNSGFVSAIGVAIPGKIGRRKTGITSTSFGIQFGSWRTSCVEFSSSTCPRERWTTTSVGVFSSPSSTASSSFSTAGSFGLPSSGSFFFERCRLLVDLKKRTPCDDASLEIKWKAGKKDEDAENERDPADP
mmetsp:Transcript_48283/g.114449  ORF Transcript_48283/g.114449 Transcript_48283/m.114449 type:complete len:396 (-) Transcript_48283:310-1497(-)